MGINVEMFSAAAEPPRERRLLPAGVPCLLYLGSVSKVRRIDFLVRVLALVKAEMPAVRLYIIGRGDEPDDRSILEKEAARVGVESSIVFVDHVPQAEAFRFVQEADVCCSPLYPSPVLRVGDPTKLIEYMAMGKAVVVNDHPEQRRLIDASHAGYCVAYEEKPFAAAIVSLLKDPAEARRMGQRGRDYVLERRAYGVIADTVEKRLLAIVEGGCR
jgi:glycosyltransferase involved in cell wall biosynthesis